MNRRGLFRALALAYIVLGSLQVITDASSIVSGVPWYDTNKNRIEAHGGGFTLVGNTYYWYGETYKEAPSDQHGVNCYSSSDLVTWKFEGLIFNQSQVKWSVAGPYVVERPKVVYNNSTKLFVLWFHLDDQNYSQRYVGIATSKTPNEQFTWAKAIQPDSVPSLDMSLYQDDNGDVYHIRSANNQYVAISKLTADYMNTEGVIAKYGSAREGPAMFKYQDIYYLITSHLTGWDPNAMEMFSLGKQIAGATFTSLGNPTGDSTTFNSQSTNVLIYKNTIIYQGDRWNYKGPGGLGNATYIWLPIIPTGGTFKIEWQSSWELP